MLARTKVLINLHHGDDLRFDWQGALDAIHAGAVVVSEHASAIAPLVSGEHLLVADADSLPFVVDALLRDEQRLAALRAQAYEWLSTWIPFALPVSVLRAAVVELVGEPVADVASLGQVTRPEPTGEAGLSADRADQSGADADAGSVPIGAVRLADESPAWGARRSVRVTVLAVVDDDEDQQRVVSMLDSVARNRMRDLELVAVATSGSREASGQVASDWMAEHPRVPARLVLAGGRTLGMARKVGLDLARGRYCLILEPGQELYPRCLEVLAGTLDGIEEATFVYPIQEVTGDAEDFVRAGGDYLLSFLGWDPDRLRRGNFIHSPALIRTERLRDVAGVSGAHESGIDDYELWCRIAERGWSGQLVPQELARRAASRSSAGPTSIPRWGAHSSRKMKSARSVR